MKISAVVLSKRWEPNPLLLDSLSFADEIIIVVDSHSSPPKSTHKKVKLFCRELGNDFSAQRNFALQKAKSDWVLFVDDDEYVGTELAREIREAPDESKISGYLIRRHDLVFHQPLLHGETGKTKILRLGRRTAGEFARPVHERWTISGRVGELRSPLYHIKDDFVSQFISRMDRYAGIDSKILTLEGKPFSWFRLLVYPPAKFKLNYLFRAGFLDGSAGLFLAYLLSVQSLTARVFQWENKN